METKNSIILVTTLYTLLLICLAEENSGYIFTSPRSLKIGSTNELQFLRFGKLDVGKVTVKLYNSESYSGNETLASEKEFDLPEGQKETFMNFFVDPILSDSVYNGRIEIDGKIGDETISGSDKVYFSSPKTNIIVIQTDKPLYKPGQEVKCRVLKLDKELKPSLNESDVGDVFVEDPKGTRLFQFNKLQLQKGFNELQFPLSEEPVLGTWTVTLQTGNDTDSTTFEVKEYVLPKFEVKIKFPPFVLADAKIVPVEVCANYTYGKPVIGQLNLNLSLEQFSYSYNYDKIPVLRESVKLDGCFKYDLNISLIQRSNSYNYRRIMVVANVVEAGTGIQRNETQYLSRQYSPLNLNFNTDQNQRQYFKPGLPYSGKLKVTNPDDSPASGEPISICYTVSRQRIIADWSANKKVKFCKNYTTEESGIIEYVIPPQNVDTTSLQLEAKSLKYANDPSQPDRSILNQPQTGMSLSPFYSPSGSFIQLENIGNTIPCGAKKDVKLLFTSKENAEFKFNYEVIRQGKVVQSGVKEVSFTTDDDVSGNFKKDNQLINDSEQQLVPPPKAASSSKPEDEECPAAKESKYVPPIGEATFDIDVDPEMSPSFTLLVFYVRDDKETVADSHKFEVEKCFKNKVNFAFTDTVKQPGQKTAIKINASPNSLCGIKVVDKSVSLMNNNDQLTKDKIYQLVQGLDTGIYYSTNPCNDHKPQPGLYAAQSAIIKPPGPYSTSSYEDSFASFQDSGFLVISNLILFTRPCSNSGGGGYGGGYHPESFAAPGNEVALQLAEVGPVYDDVGESSLDESDAVSTKSAVDVRENFPDTWLFNVEYIGWTNKFLRFVAPAENYPISHTIPFFSQVKLSNKKGKPVALASVARRPAGAAPAADTTSTNMVTTKSVVEVRRDFPETWLFSMEMTGDDGEFLKKETLPDTITEWIGSAACVSPDDGFGMSDTSSIKGFQLFFISYTLPTSAVRGEEFFVVVSVFSYAEGALPVTVSLEDPEGYEVTSDSINGDICVLPGSSENFRIKLKATTVGKINITVRAETAKDNAVCGSTEIASSVAKDAITQSLNVEAEGFPVDTVQSILFCPKDSEKQTFEVSHKLDLPTDVVEDSARAYIDVTGNVMGPAIRNLNKLVSLPTGCGEQNLVKFTPNYLVLDYLTDIGKLTDSIKYQAIRNLNKGYQRQLTYRHQDGSFSAFGETDKTGSMFLTAFVLRSFHQAKRHISIDDNILKSAQEWIVSHQQADGCFPDIGHIISSGIQGGLEKEKNPTAITAYVLASLLIAQYDNQTVIDAAKSCLAQNSGSSPYETFLIAYAEALAGDKESSKKRLTDMKPFAITKDGAESYLNPNGTKAVNIETASYAILTNLKLDNSVSDALPLVRYLTQNMKSTGGFYSTQDTCVGLEALSNFAKLVYKDPVNIDVSVKGGTEQKVEISQDNKLLVQRNKVSEVPSVLEIEATGSGCGLIQTSLRYNTKTAPDTNKFYLGVSGECSSADCKRKRVFGTVNYLPDGKKAGMSVVQIKMPTGHVPLKESLTELTDNKKTKVIRTDFENNEVVLYFPEVSNGGEAFEFQVEEVVEVENSQPGTAKVFEYYAPENTAATTYSFEKPGATEQAP